MPQKESRREQFKWILAGCCAPCLLMCLYLGDHFYISPPPPQFGSFTFRLFKITVSFTSNVLNNRKKSK